MNPRRALLLTALLALGGCAGSDLHAQAATASGIAVVANVELEQLGEVFDADLQEALKQAARDEDASAAAQHRSPNREPAMDAAKAAVEKRWIPIWGDASGARLGAWETFRAMHNAWADQLEAGDAKAALVPRVNAAYCDLLTALPAKYRARVTIPAISCPAQVTP